MKLVSMRMPLRFLRVSSRPMPCSAPTRHSKVRVAADSDALRVEVVNDAPEMVAAIREPSVEGGRGLHIVDALACRWGVDVRDDEKVVWFELQTGRTNREL
jgi:hypothetical protein